MRVMVTGAAGYVGSHTVLSLMEAGHEVFAVDDLSTGKGELLRLATDFAQADILDSYRMGELVKYCQAEAVIHLAGVVKVEESVRHPLNYYRSNVEGMRSVLEAVVGRVQYLVFSSTAAVYGSAKLHPVSEDAELAPLSPYGRSKLMAEHMLEDVAAAHGLRYVALRYFNVAGADPRLRAGYSLEGQPTHLIKAALAVALGRTQEPFYVYGVDYPTPDGTAIRDFVHVTDLAGAHAKVLQYLCDGGKSGALNCGYGKGRSVLEVVDAVRQASGIHFCHEVAPRRPGDAASIVADTSRIQKFLPRWQPRFNALGDMVKHQLAWESSQI